MNKIRRALDHSGYSHVKDTEENLRECFMDYVDSGVWVDLSLDDVDDLTIDDMIKGLMRLR